MLRKQLRTKDHRVHLGVPEIRGEVERLKAANGHDPAFPLRMIGLRELRSHNSWMHNAPLLMRGGRTHAARIHPDDAEALGLGDGDRCTVASAHGSIEIEALLTDEIKPGRSPSPTAGATAAAGSTANAAGGANVNLLASSDPADLERLAGMAFLNGIPVRVEPVELAREQEPEAAAVA